VVVLQRLSDIAGKYFAAWILLAATIAFFIPPLSGILTYVNPLLGLVMFGMGLTLTFGDFARVFRRPKGIAVGVLAQFTVMPLLAFSLALLFDLPPELAAGVVLLGCCPGGTASNVITYLARGDVSMSVSMTSVSTILAPLLTPVLMLLLAGRWLPVDAGALFVSILQIVLLPVALGVLVNTFLSRPVQRVRPILPLVSVVTIVVIVMGVVAASSENLLAVGPLVFLIVVVHTTSAGCCSATLSPATWDSTPPSDARSPSKSGCRTRDSPPDSPPRTSAAWPLCPVQSSASGTTSRDQYWLLFGAASQPERSPNELFGPASLQASLPYRTGRLSGTGFGGGNVSFYALSPPLISPQEVWRLEIKTFP
jgi:BASS family bile acid:Na+ symporter